VHTSVVYFIDPSGNERFAASPMANHTTNGASYLPSSAGRLGPWRRTDSEQADPLMMPRSQGRPGILARALGGGTRQLVSGQPGRELHEPG
jgi:hypothetical protein